jgi:small-conductance mechanosensitive channel
VDSDRLWDLLVDTDSAGGLGVTTGAILLVAAVLRLALVPLARRRYRDDPYRRYWSGKVVTYVLGAIVLVVLIALWAPLGGRLSVIIGFATAGVAFAMQEVIGSLFGWLNILAGRIYTVGDRIEVGGVRGDVLDITPLRTKLLEFGTPASAGDGSSSWVTARQPTGRMVTISNRKTFTEPVFNFSAHLDWLWEELAVAVPRRSDWARAEAIVLEEIRGHAPELRRRGEEELARLGERYLVGRAEVEPRTFVRLVDGDVEIVGRFVTRVDNARGAKDAITRRVLERFREEGLELAYTTYAVEVEGGAGAREDGVAGAPAPPSSSTA